MKSFVYTCQKSEINEMYDKLKAKLDNPALINFISNYDDFSDISAKLHDVFPNADIIGTTGYSFCNGNCNRDGISIFAVMGEVVVQGGVLEDISSHPIKHIKTVENALDKVKGEENNSVCFEFCTGAEEQVVTTLNFVLQKQNVGLIGGTSSATPSDKVKYVSYNGKIYQNSCVFAIVKSLKGRVKVYKENIYEAFGDSYTATDVDVQTRRVIKLDNKRATEVFAKGMGIKEDDILKYQFTNPLCREIKGETYICGIKEVFADGSIACYKNVYCNDLVKITDIGNYKSIINGTLDMIKNEFSNGISGFFSINCFHRYLYFEEQGYTLEYAKTMEKIHEHCGMISDGEQYNSQHVNLSMVCVVFE
ncbi:MAG: FIST N domain protein [Alphaproteobacteria bacterium ADurb.Bin438]|nr:MAG: FIST N domain protein [Alphaproteobacteria bacterium ADurb.Bin438]